MKGKVIYNKRNFALLIWYLLFRDYPDQNFRNFWGFRKFTSAVLHHIALWIFQFLMVKTPLFLKCQSYNLFIRSQMPTFKVNSCKLKVCSKSFSKIGASAALWKWNIFLRCTGCGICAKVRWCGNYDLKHLSMITKILFDFSKRRHMSDGKNYSFTYDRWAERWPLKPNDSTATCCNSFIS